MTFADHGSIPPRARRTLPYAAGVVALFVAAGCTSGSPQSAPPGTAPLTTSSSATTTPAPTTTAKPTPTVDPVIAKIPAAARPETIEGASAFAKFYFDTLNGAFRNADPSALNGLSTPSCTMCNSLAEGVSNVRAAGNHYGGDLARVNYSSTSEFTPSSRKVLIDLDQVSVPIINAAGKTVDKTRSAKLSFLATLKYDKRWIITRLQKAT